MSKELFIQNLPFDITEEELRTLFAVSGTVTFIRMLNNPRTGQFGGAAFVKMSSEKEAKDAIVCLDEAIVHNRPISVSPALSPQQREAARAHKAAPKRGGGTSSGWSRVPTESPGSKKGRTGGAGGRKTKSSDRKKR